VLTSLASLSVGAAVAFVGAFVGAAVAFVDAFVGAFVGASVDAFDVQVIVFNLERKSGFRLHPSKAFALVNTVARKKGRFHSQ
jgi:hypothetical protein